MTIAEAGEKYSLSTDTLRYYERIGLIPPVNRTKGGKRDYTDTDCRWVEFIKCMRGAGLAVEVMIEYVSLFQKGDSTRNARKAILIDQREKLAQRTAELQETLNRLDVKIARYDTALLEAEKNLFP
ncbi:MAG: MerR family transcriptional regulator [Treponema sp.]|jgi:DNA-binding transcriptional MerR regulator|nr:MerR family transcriptional regulator [Treponema sp.]